MNYRNAMWTAVAFMLCGTALAAAQAPVPGPHKGGMATVQVTMFTQLERQLLAAQQDKTLLDAMLTEDFQEFSAERPTEPLDRQEAMQRALAAGKIQGGFRDMAVRMEGDTAIVSFVFLHRAEPQAAERAGALFVVDVWRKRGEAYELAARYAAPMRKPANMEPPRKE